LGQYGKPAISAVYAVKSRVFLVAAALVAANCGIGGKR
jgi:hypothetical protein